MDDQGYNSQNNPNQGLLYNGDRTKSEDDLPSENEVISSQINQNQNNTPEENYCPPPISQGPYPPENNYPPPQEPYAKPVDEPVVNPQAPVPPPNPEGQNVIYQPILPSHNTVAIPVYSQPQYVAQPVYVQHVVARPVVARPVVKVEPTYRRDIDDYERRRQDEEDCLACCSFLCICCYCLALLVGGGR